mgnify:CR=1 FL=1
MILSKNGDRWEGEFRDGQLNGRCVVSYANGTRYEGQCAQHQFEIARRVFPPP